MYKEILVPLDGSKLAESILPYVRCLAEALKVPVHLLHVKDPKIKALFSQPLQEDDYLKNVASSMLASFTVRYTVEIGKPAKVIVNTAARDLGTLITMATQGRSEIQRWLLGSVSNKVLFATRNPLVLMRATQQKQPSDSVQLLRTIVVPLDGSPFAEKILPYVLEIAKALKSEVILVRAYSLPRGSHAFAKRFYVPYTDQLAESVKKEARTYLEAKVQELQAERIARVSYRLMEETGTVEIIDLARKTPDNMLAMYTPRKSGVGRLVIGNVTERIMRRWDNPVLVVRA
jgi:nucleotide-binding universal stress UspA family protein